MPDKIPEKSRTPIFKAILGDSWNDLPDVMRQHYMVRPYSDDTVVVKGHLDITISRMMSAIARVTGKLLAYSGKNIPVTVTFRSGSNSNAFYFERVFHYPDRGDIHFYSRMEPIGGNELIEFMGFGIGWKVAYAWDDGKMILRHRGYFWRVFGLLVPLPLGWIIGEAYAEETPVSDTAFAMWTHTQHVLFGETLRYAGAFEIAEVSCPEQF